jgi:hypothetical protein
MTVPTATIVFMRTPEGESRPVCVTTGKERNNRALAWIRSFQEDAAYAECTWELVAGVPLEDQKR